jgi:hypothetical protein
MQSPLYTYEVPRPVWQLHRQKRASSKASYIDLDIVSTAACLMIATTAELMRCFSSLSFLFSGVSLSSQIWLSRIRTKNSIFHLKCYLLGYNAIRPWLCLSHVFTLVSCLHFLSTLKTEATYSFATSVDFQRARRHYFPEDRTVRNHRCEHLRSYIFHLQSARKRIGM